MKASLLIPAILLSAVSASCFAQAHYAANVTAAAVPSANSATTYNSSAYGNTIPASTYQPTPTTAGNTAYASAAPARGYMGGQPAPANSYTNNTYLPNNTTTQRTAYTPPVTRYNYAARANYAYYPSAHSTDHHIKQDNVKNGRDQAPGQHIPYRSMAARFIPYCPVLDFPLLCYAGVANDGQRPYYGFSALNVSFDGYVIHGRDTLTGIVTLTNNNVFIEQSAGAGREYGYHFAYSDKDLTNVVVYNGNDALTLARVNKDDTRLSRVLCTGKLSVYDGLFSFSQKIDENQLQVAYDGHVKMLGAFVVLDMRSKLIKTVNKVYGANLSPESFRTTQQVVHYINTHY